MQQTADILEAISRSHYVNMREIVQRRTAVVATQVGNFSPDNFKLNAIAW